MSSDGWIWIGPIADPRLEPPEYWPIPGTKTTIKSEKATRGSTKRSFLMKAVGIRLASTAAVTPIPM